MPIRMTKKGFPTVHQLDLNSLSASLARPQTDTLSSQSGSEPPKKKKSLFAQQFERHGLEYFGIEVTELAGSEAQTAFKKDFVQPIALGGSVSSEDSSVKEKVLSGSAAISADAQDMEVDDGGGVAREEFESGASQAWGRYVYM